MAAVVALTPGVAQAAWNLDATYCEGNGSYNCGLDGYAAYTGTWADTRYYGGYHNCTRYAAYRLARNGVSDQGTWGNAEEWDTRAPYPVNGSAAPGAIAQWNAGGYGGSVGHVAYVEEVHADHIVISQDNWGGVTSRGRINNGSPKWPNNFIHVADVGPPGGSRGRVPGDFNGDGRTDLASWRPSTGEWFVRDQFSNVQWGWSDDVPVPGDFNGDGRTDLASWRPSTGEWFVRDQFSNVQWGWSDDVPVPGDYNGDGRTDLASWRPSTGEWFVRDQFSNVQWGWSDDVPVPGDYNGDGRTDLATWRPSTGEWFVQGQFSNVQWGWIGDVPVPGDYNGDGRTDLAVWRPSTGEWFVRDQFTNVQWGWTDDVPVPGDYNGDGRTDLATWRPSTGEWFVRDQFSNVQWGWSDDLPAVQTLNRAMLGRLRAPSASFTAAQSPSSLAVAFDASDSRDRYTGWITRYAWDFGDGTTGDLVSPGHTYAAPGTYTVGLTVTDNSQRSTSTTRQVVVAPRPGAFAGTVTAEASGAALEGIRVQLCKGGVVLAETLTDADGRYFIGGLEPAPDYKVRFVGTATYLNEFNGDAPTLGTAPTLALAPGGVTGADAAMAARSSRATVSGTVTDRVTGDPVAAVSVRVYLNGVFHRGVMTRPDGTWTVDGLDPAAGDWTVRYSDLALRYKTEWSEHALKPNAALPVGLETGVETVLDAQLTRFADLVRVSGTVTSDVDGSPLAGVEVRLYQHGVAVTMAVTDASGRWAITTIPDDYEIRFSDPAGAWWLEWYNDARTRAAGSHVELAPTDDVVLDVALAVQ